MSKEVMTHTSILVKVGVGGGVKYASIYKL